MFKLRDYQQDAVDATLHHFRRTTEPAVIVLPTGAGKSLVIAELARLAKRKILMLTHVKELVEQNYSKFRQYSSYAKVKAGVYSAGLKQKQTEFQVTFASVQSVARNLEQFQTEYSLVIVDECHRVSSLSGDSQYGKIIEQLKQYNPKLMVLGLTATPYRLDKGWIYQFHHHGIRRTEESTPFKKCIFELPLARLINQGFLTKPNLVKAATEQYNFAALQPSANGSYAEQDVNELLAKYPRVTQAIIEQVEQLSENRQGVMIFAATVKHAEEIASYLPESQTAVVTGETKLKSRDELIEQFKTKQIKYLVNVSVLTTGFDAPHVDFIAVLRPTESISLYQQIVGRGLRLADNKHECLVIDYAGNDINLFYPEIGEKKPAPNTELVQVLCPACGFANAFWGKKDAAGEVIEHYGRKCQGAFEDPDDLSFEACDYRFVFKECPNCNEHNDIAARVCNHCQHVLADPDDKLKQALKLKNHIVIRCSGVTFTAQQQTLFITYHDEDGVELKEKVDFSAPKQRNWFNKTFGARFNFGQQPTTFSAVEPIVKDQHLFAHPDFVIAKKEKHFHKITEKIFDYKGNFRKAY